MLLIALVTFSFAFRTLNGGTCPQKTIQRIALRAKYSATKLSITNYGGTALHGCTSLPINSRPCSNARLPTEAPLEERTISLLCHQPSDTWDLASKYSFWPKLIRITTYIIKFISLCRRRQSCCDNCLSSFSPVSSLSCIEKCRAFYIRLQHCQNFLDSENSSCLIFNGNKCIIEKSGPLVEKLASLSSTAP